MIWSVALYSPEAISTNSKQESINVDKNPLHLNNFVTISLVKFNLCLIYTKYKLIIFVCRYQTT